MQTEEIQISPKLTDYELRLMKTARGHTKMSRRIFKSIHKFAVRFKLKRLEMWSYLKWLNTYPGDLFGFWEFSRDYLNCDLNGEIKP